jgi:hypothetical protein
MDKREFEKKGEKFLIKWMGQEKVVLFKIFGEQKKKDAEALFNVLDEFIKIFPEFRSLKVLIDLTDYIKTDFEARRFYTAKLTDLLKDNFIAAYGASALGRLVVGFITVAAGKQDFIKFFKTEKEALKWLKEK